MSETASYLRFVAFGILMAFANVVPYLLTRSDNVADGFEVAGWPLRCYAIGGIGGFHDFSPWAMAGNIAIAVIVSAFAAWVFRHGVLRTLRKWQTWGTPYAE